ncbi:MAG: bifunctional adenosylcobinamide kinase/adenosylcobinamide-phosphate guanylyltransferase [Deltaproteobacteria bacterium]|jgi:adenosylcobinamide kinase/adenosylcobinamide-phosphate guanylyltransferase|nr:bifunctional adenosylcobinamide kinase/adenosylcobinamide-phosphate guanylyltransferase [Deltaproteobacteria bacterium]
MTHTAKKEIVLVLGGARSGKSSWALEYIEKSYHSYIFLATAEVMDEEMADRVDLHRKARGPKWQLREEPLEIADVVKSNAGSAEAMLIDCMTIWLSNVLLKKGAEKVPVYQNALLEALVQSNQSVVIVSNEVGSGIVPEHPLGRQYRDMAGSLNQKLAAVADQVLLIVAGLPIFLKQSHP